ncbi:MAG: SRPBCC family protein [Parafilimonas sp.]
MNAEQKIIITVESIIDASIEKVWDYFTKPEHITKWNNASDDWFTPRAENDLRVGGNFIYRMEAKDGSFGFDFGGIYDTVDNQSYIEYTLGDGRKVQVTFTEDGSKTKLTEKFEAENMNSVELQKNGWQAILNNFKKYVEEN